MEIVYWIIFFVFCFGWYKMFESISKTNSLYNLVYNNLDYQDDFNGSENNTEEDFVGNESNVDYEWRQDPYYLEQVLPDGKFVLFDMELDLDNIKYV